MTNNGTIYKIVKDDNIYINFTYSDLRRLHKYLSFLIIQMEEEKIKKTKLYDVRGGKFTVLCHTSNLSISEMRELCEEYKRAEESSPRVLKE